MIEFKVVITNPDNLKERFILHPDNKDLFRITRGDGEGGQFSNKKFYEVVKKFYEDNF